MNIGLKEIADKANVSLATVSLVLNDKPGVGERTREKILKIAEEIQYNPKSKKVSENKETGTIKFLKIVKHGHILNEDHRVFISDYMDGLSRAAKRDGYHLLVSSYESSNIAEIVDSLDFTTFTGLVVLGTELDEEDFKIFKNIERPVVIIDACHDFHQLNFIDMDNREAVFKIVSHFVEKGHQEIGFIGSTMVTRNFSLRQTGLCESLDYYNLPARKEWFHFVDSTFNGAYKDMLNILAKKPNLPKAFFVANDIIALGCIRAFKEMNITIPEEVSIIAFDDIPAAAMCDPPLTSIKVSKIQIGEMAIQVLERELQKDRVTHSSKLLVSSELVERKSVRNLNERSSNDKT